MLPLKKQDMGGKTLKTWWGFVQPRKCIFQPIHTLFLVATGNIAQKISINNNNIIYYIYIEQALTSILNLSKPSIS
jgi:hypothetical protein